MMNKRYFDEYRVGDKFTAGSHRVDRDEMMTFAKQWDPQPQHTDESYASATSYGGITAPGCYMIAVAIRLISGMENGPALIAAIGWDEIRFLKAVRPGDEMTLTVECLKKRSSRSRPDRGIIQNRLTITNQDGDRVLTFNDRIFVKKRHH